MATSESFRHFSRHRFFRYCSEATQAMLLPEFLKGEIFDGQPIRQVETKKPYVAITFDDGINPDQVELFLTLCQHYETKCTVFPYGLVMTKSPDLWRAVNADGHEIGNHSHSHLNVAEASKEEIYADFARFETDDYPSVIGADFPEPGLARVPFAQGPVNRDVQQVIGDLRDLHVHWRLDSYSWKKGGRYSKTNLEYVMERMANVRQGDIIILHFVELDMIAFPWILDLLASRGLVNVTFSTLWKNRRQTMKKRS